MRAQDLSLRISDYKYLKGAVSIKQWLLIYGLWIEFKVSTNQDEEKFHVFFFIKLAEI